MPEDAEREPLLAEKGSPIYTDPRLMESGKTELEGYLLNDGGKGCVFLNARTNLCTIYKTRPPTCRHFDCDGEDRRELEQLGILPPRSEALGR